MSTFTIQVLDTRSKKNEKWNDRTTVEAETANKALLLYAPSLRKQGKIKLGKGTTNRGKTFRAIAAE